MLLTMLTPALLSSTDFRKWPRQCLPSQNPLITLLTPSMAAYLIRRVLHGVPPIQSMTLAPRLLLSHLDHLSRPLLRMDALTRHRLRHLSKSIDHPQSQRITLKQ